MSGSEGLEGMKGSFGAVSHAGTKSSVMLNIRQSPGRLTEIFKVMLTATQRR